MGDLTNICLKSYLFISVYLVLTKGDEGGRETTNDIYILITQKSNSNTTLSSMTGTIDVMRVAFDRSRHIGIQHETEIRNIDTKWPGKKSGKI